MHALQIDLTTTFIIVSVSVALIMLLRLCEVLAERSAQRKTKRILQEYMKSREKEESE